MELKKLSPWNWFRKEHEHNANLPVTRNATFGYPLTRLHTEIDRMFDDFLKGSGIPDFGFGRWPTESAAFLKPKLDISETDEQYKIEVEVPGVTEKDIKVDLEGDTLTIRGEKRQESKTEKDKYHSIERSYGSFMRTLNLPANADSDKINAKFKNGVLTISIMKKAGETAGGKTVSIEKG